MVRIEEAFNKHLSNEALENGLDFAAYMREQKFVFKGKGAKWDIDTRNWKLLFKGKIYATIIIEKNQTFGVYGDFDSSFIVDDNLKKAVLKKVTLCPQEPCKKRGTICKTSVENYEILGKKFERVCHCPVQFTNPGAKDIDTIQKIMLLYKEKALCK